MCADTPQTLPDDWLAALDRAEADVSAGRVHDLEEVVAEIEADITEMESGAVATPR